VGKPMTGITENAHSVNMITMLNDVELYSGLMTLYSYYTS